MRRSIFFRSRVVLVVFVLLILVTLVACREASTPAQAPAEPSAPANPLHGVWSMTTLTPDGEATIDPSQPGVFIFTEGHYSAVYSLGAEPRPRAAVAFTATAEEKVAQYDTIIVNTGTYEVSGSTITYRPIVAKSSEFMGGEATASFEINGDSLTLRALSVQAADGAFAPGANGEAMTLRRIE